MEEIGGDLTKDRHIPDISRFDEAVFPMISRPWVSNCWICLGVSLNMEQRGEKLLTSYLFWQGRNLHVPGIAEMKTVHFHNGESSNWGIYGYLL